jgi:ribosomal protein L16 Arg81 hydroxylase
MNPNFSEIVSKEEIEELDKPEAIVDQIIEQCKIDQHIVRKNEFEKHDHMIRKKWEECFRAVDDIKVKEYWIRGMRDNK